GRHDTEYELVDTGIFLVDTGIFDDDRYWAVEVEYAKATPTDLCMLITVANRGPDPATLHVLPTLWFRNACAWGLPGRDRTPSITLAPPRPGVVTLVADHWAMGR